MLVCRSMHERYGVLLVHLSPLKYTPNSQLTKVCSKVQAIDFYIFFIGFNEKKTVDRISDTLLVADRRFPLIGLMNVTRLGPVHSTSA